MKINAQEVKLYFHLKLELTQKPSKMVEITNHLILNLLSRRLELGDKPQQQKINIQEDKQGELIMTC